MSDGGIQPRRVIEMGVEHDIQRPARSNPMKGKTSYPFAELAVGDHFLVARNHSTVRAAVRRFEERNKGSKLRFETWKGGDKRIVVKRVK